MLQTEESRQGKRVLLVEDDDALARVLTDLFSLEGFNVRHAGTAADAIAQSNVFHPDLVLLDVTLPDESGFNICRALRRRGAAALIMLTARVQKADKLRGLDMGADDYVTKPFDTEELVARVRAVLRRAQTQVEVVTVGEFAVNLHTQRAVSKASTVELTRRECDLLRYLGEKKNHIVYRDELLREVWGFADSPLTRCVDSAVARLRKKLEANPHRPRFIHTVHGDGYCLGSLPGEDPR